MRHSFMGREMIMIFGMKILMTCTLFMAVATSSHAETLEISGVASIGKQSPDFEMTLSKSQGFQNRLSGYLSMVTGFDGNSFWRVENGAGPFEIDFSEKEIWVAIHWILSGYWLHQDAPLQWSEDAITGNAIFTVKDGQLKILTNKTLAQLKSVESVFPLKLVASNLPQVLSVDFVGQQTLSEQQFPKSIVINGIGEVENFIIKTAVKTISKPQSLFNKPQRKLSDSRFNANVSSQVEIKQAKSGHIFVRPIINNQVVGWFLFDSGAGSSMMSQELIDKFSLQRVANTISGGIGGSTGYSDVYQGAMLKLGPLEVNNLNYKVYDPSRSMATRLLGEPVVGVLGWDILLRSVVEVDMLKATMSIYSPSAYRVPKEDRQRLYLHWKVPYVKANFSPDHEGIFMLDTGAGNKGIFFTNFSVNTFDLLKDKQGQKSNAQGAGGRVPIIKGQIDWFEVANHKTNNADAVFSIGEDHEADIFSTGFLGGAVIEPFKVVFDYGRNEVGFIRRH